MLTGSSTSTDARDNEGGTALVRPPAARGGQNSTHPLKHPSPARRFLTVPPRSIRLSWQHLAAYQGHADVVRALIAGGSSVDAIDHVAVAPLHRATYNGHTAVVLALLEGGAKVDVQNIQGVTPLVRVYGSQTWECSPYLTHTIASCRRGGRAGHCSAKSCNGVLPRRPTIEDAVPRAALAAAVQASPLAPLLEDCT